MKDIASHGVERLGRIDVPALHGRALVGHRIAQALTVLDAVVARGHLACLPAAVPYPPRVMMRIPGDSPVSRDISGNT